jgi:signal transduction histidine kinase/CheY-like chemotaxis protein
LFTYYQRAHALLEEAREHRLALSEANRELEEAYAQLSRLYELLRASRMEAEAARRAKEEFVANVSHELRTPLNMIIGFSEMIVQSPTAYGPKLPRPLLSDIGVIHRNAKHLAQLINDVLDLSQIEAGRFSLNREWTDLSRVIEEAAQAVVPLYQAKGLYLKVELPESLPLVYCDRLRTRQVILNLLSNAGRFTQTGGATVKARVDEKRVVISVSDTGPGIRQEDLEKIFEPFRQLDGSTRRVHGGSGLGLSISKRLVELHKGEMWVESEPGVGTSFSFSLPLQPEVSLDGDGASDALRWVNPYTTHEPRIRRRVRLPKPKPRLLIMERDGVLDHQARALFEDVEIIKVENLEELRAELKENPPEVLLVNDAGIMEDRGLIRRMLDLSDRTVVVSCYIPGKAEACEHLNVVEYLVKPVTREELLEAAQRIAPPSGCLLVVEDDVTMARLIARQLRSAGRGYRILRASDGEQALEFMRSRQPDAVFLDLGLPDQDGYQVLAEKNADPKIRHIPVVIVSARDPWGEPVVANRLRVELPGGLSTRDILMCTMGISQALSVHSSPLPEPSGMLVG